MSDPLAARRNPAFGRPLRRLGVLTLAGALISAAAVLPRPAAAADVDVGVSVGISRPGVYGRIDIGRYPAPAWVSPTPVWVAPQPVALWVPPGHRKNWRKHCHRYGACGVPVVFVQDRWAHERGPGAYRHRDDRWERRRGRDRDD